MADNSARINAIQTILRNGVTDVETEGVKVKYDFAALRQELRDLMESDDANKGRRPVASSVNLGGF